mgnify:CR=1 FL=1
MTHSFLAFIDEAGDDGLGNYRQFGRNGGSSHWLVLSALIIRKTNSLATVGWRDEILRKLQKDKGALHFVKLDHGQRIVASESLSSRPARVVNIVASKRLLTDSVFQRKNQLYFYLARYLIERVSWLCRDMRPRVSEGNGQVAITFSRRGGMSYENFRDYLSHLKTDDHDVRVHWPVVDIDAVNAQDHSKMAALQLADIVASSFSAAVEYNRYGHCEDRYAKALKPLAYRHNGRHLGYGHKFIPQPEDCGLCPQQFRIIEAFK